MAEEICRESALAQKAVQHPHKAPLSSRAAIERVFVQRHAGDEHCDINTV